MILREIKNMYIKNRLTEGVDFKRYEWLKMDIPESISIDIMSLPINSNNVEFKRNWIQITNSEYFRTSNYIYYITDYGDIHDLCPMVWKITPSQIQYIDNINLGLGLHTIITNSNGVTISGNSKVASLSWYGNPITYMKFNSMMVFNTHTIHLTSSIKIDGVTRYVPCQLLRSIPSTLDANNIARSAGECGMYDSISGKFYGNVNNTGTFTVEGDVEPETHSGLQQIYQNRLIEGVDYETYDWLKYTNWVIPANENVLYGAQLNCELKVTTILKFTIKLGEIIHRNNSDIELAVSSSTRTYYIRRDYFNNNVAVYSPVSKKISNSFNLGSVLDFLITEEGLFVNDVCLINEKIEYISQFGRAARSCTGSISSVITEEGVDVLVPCTLLRSIPRNLDAQCKERQAGECGMIDLISGKFYGNVANSGTFTVENDSN